MKHLTSAACALYFMLSLSSAMAEPAAPGPYDALIPPLNSDVNAWDCPTVPELKSEFKGHLLKPFFDGYSLPVRDPSNGFSFEYLEGVGKNAYWLKGFYRIKHAGKEGNLYMIAASSDSSHFSPGFVLYNVLRALSAGSIGAVPANVAPPVDEKNSACMYQLSFLNGVQSEKYIVYARPR